MEPDARSRDIFSFHQPQTLLEMVQAEMPLRGWLRRMPPVPEPGLWPKQLIAIRNLEASLYRGKPKALIQMATGSGKTFTAANIAYRLIKYGHARRVCFLLTHQPRHADAQGVPASFQPPQERHTFDRIYNIAFPAAEPF
jgi:type I restriction enzyme R subunit